MPTYGAVCEWGVIDQYPGVPDDEIVFAQLVRIESYQYMLFL